MSTTVASTSTMNAIHQLRLLTTCNRLEILQIKNDDQAFFRTSQLIDRDAARPVCVFSVSFMFEQFRLFYGLPICLHNRFPTHTLCKGDLLHATIHFLTSLFVYILANIQTHTTLVLVWWKGCGF